MSTEEVRYWYKNAVFYGLDVSTFQDSNGDGIGDFPGLCRRLDYLVDLGVTCIWLLPFFPSPDRDNGYDVMDYFSVDPKLGTFEDFLTFVRGAGERGLRVMIDLVPKCTGMGAGSGHEDSSSRRWALMKRRFDTMFGTRASRRRVKRSLSFKETPPVRAGFFICR